MVEPMQRYSNMQPTSVGTIDIKVVGNLDMQSTLRTLHRFVSTVVGNKVIQGQCPQKQLFRTTPAIKETTHLSV